MSTPLTDSIQNLTDYINEVTGGEDTNLSDAVATLADGYGSSGISIDDFISGVKPTGIVITNSTSMRRQIGSFSNIVEFHAPRLITIPQDAFSNCSTLEILDCPSATSILTNACYSCIKLRIVDMRNNVSNITSGTFYGCTSLVDINLNKTRRINANAFRNCTALKIIKLPSCGVLEANAFNGCTGITDIYLPNDASTYSGAPWGAPETCTIHYNTRFDENGEPIIE